MARLGYKNREQTQHDEHVSSQKAVREVMASPQARVCLSDANGEVETVSSYMIKSRAKNYYPGAELFSVEPFS